MQVRETENGRMVKLRRAVFVKRGIFKHLSSIVQSNAGCGREAQRKKNRETTGYKVGREKWKGDYERGLVARGIEKIFIRQ